MKILLVEPDDRHLPGLNFGGLWVMEPLSLELLAASVSEHQVKILDLRLDPLPLKHYLDTLKPDLVGVTGITALHSQMQSILGEAKQAGAFTVAGGPHASFAYEDFGQEVDAVVVGEGEGTFRSLVETLESHGDLSQVPNLVWRKDGQWIRNRQQLLDLWPFPCRCFVRDYKYYAFGHEVAMLEATRGCPHRCTFCVTPKLFKGRYRVKPIEELISYIAMRPEGYLLFADPDFMASSKYTASLARGLKKRGVKKKYFINIRTDEVVSNPVLVKGWSDLGFSFALIGIEAYKSSQLDAYHKGTTLDLNKLAVEVLRRANVLSIGTFIVEPSFTSQEFKEYLAYIRQLGTDIRFLSVLTPFPGTSIEKEYQINASYERFDVLHAVTPTVLPPEEFERNFISISKKALGLGDIFRLVFRLWRKGLLSKKTLLPMAKYMRSYGEHL